MRTLQIRRGWLRSIAKVMVPVACLTAGALILWFVLQAIMQRGSFSISTIAVPTKLAAAQKPQNVSAGLPVRLKIPTLNVDAPIDQMGVTSSGEMEAPQGAKNVGWFKFGTRPGEVGSAVIAGHYGRWRDGGGSVFDNVSKLKKGDALYVEDESGEIFTFVVRESRTYDKAEKTANVFESSDGAAHLNLVTCQGAWNESERTYAKRLVVFADRAP